MAAGFPHAQNMTKMVLGRLAVLSAVVSLGIQNRNIVLFVPCAELILSSKKECAADFSG